ncbi:hypothetical protein FRX31_022461 [Thalictrum thalictroides]|uniref:NAC domain-containing protein n=1 Tax=Thalictrum thalictroides TaxID=46969 RepID=A0A7J6VST4_THATH|nr:hypothetical protein FRX31_022461 [Thalictrum thalictroides]
MAVVVNVAGNDDDMPRFDRAFQPSDEQCINILIAKFQNPLRYKYQVTNFNIYSVNPEQIILRSDDLGYFYTPRVKRTETTTTNRPNREAGEAGRWPVGEACKMIFLSKNGNFRRVWEKFISDPRMANNYVSTSSRNENNERVFKVYVVNGSIGMKEEDKAKIIAEWMEGLMERMRVVRGMSIFDHEAVKVGKEVSLIKKKSFSFAKALIINGDQLTEELDEDYALFLATYAEDMELSWSVLCRGIAVVWVLSRQAKFEGSGQVTST